MAAGLLALGVYAPDKVLTNKDLESFMDTSDEWITTRTGIRERRISAPSEYASDLAVKATQNLIERYGQKAMEGVDQVIVATNTPDAYFPNTAALVADQLGLEGAAGYDLLAGCPGWLYGLAQAAGQVEAGIARKVLVIGSEAISKILDWRDRTTAVLFGDGAGAAIVGRVPEGHGFRSFVLGADGSGGKTLHMAALASSLPDGTRMGPTISMHGREVFKFAVRVMDTATIEAIEKAGMHPDEISLFVPHQANERIIGAARERLGLDWDRVVLNLDRYGNTSTASIPLALAEALDAGKINKGDNLLFVSFGAGLTWAATVLTWGSV